MDDLNNAALPPLQLLPPLRRWQREATVITLAALEKQDHRYIQAPMGTGKTRVIFEICKSPAIVGTRLLIVGLGSIVSQHRKAFLRVGCLPTSHEEDEEDFETPTGQRVAILTWQRLYRLARRGENPFEGVGIIFFDECHIGASGDDLHDDGALKQSFDFFKPVKRVYVSATPGMVNEKLLGSKEGHIYKLSLRQAYDDGLLNPLEMIEVHAGDRARIAAVEAATQQKMEDLQMLEAENTAGLAKELLAKGVELGDAKQAAEAVFRIVQQRHDVMIELYMERHPNVQAIFFSPTIVHANDATDRFNQLARKRRLDGLRAHSVNSKAANYAEQIERFREGQTRILFVVGMLQEGFDMPDLWLGFDCRFYSKWKPNRVSRLVQKLGRLLRRADKKPDSQYYYARDITDFYNIRNGAGRRHPAPLDLGTLDAEAGEEFPIDLADDEADSEEATQLFVAGALAAADDERGDVPLRPITTEVVTIEAEIDTVPITPSTKRVRLRKQMLYVLRDVRGHTIEKTVPFETLFQSKSDALWDHMQEEARKGGPRPAWKTRENEALHNYRSQQPEKYKILVDINPKWAEIRGEKSQRELLRMAEAGQPKPKQGTPLGNALNSYRQRNPEFYARLIEICPDWGIGRDDSFAQQFERIRELGLNGESRPARGSSEGHFLGNLMRTRPEKYQALLDEAPSLRTEMEKRQSELRQMAQTGARRPLSGTPDGIRWNNYMQEPANSFTQEILKIRPDWGVHRCRPDAGSPPRHGEVQCAASGKKTPPKGWLWPISRSGTGRSMMKSSS